MRNFILMPIFSFLLFQSANAFEIYFDEHYLDIVADTVVDGSEYEVAAIPVVAILAAAGLFVIRKSIVQTMTSQAASKAALNYSRGKMKKVGRKCFSVRGEGGSRLLLEADKVTVLWGGNSHDMYENKISKLCS